ncbi:MAG: ArsA-related P-loop ATPase [Pseudomonadota bacterium]
MSAPLSLPTLLRQRRILLCGGTGGVGKTTTAAALGLAAARLGIRTLVLTIDPARRLADAVGLPAIGPEPTRTALHENLYLMMLDPEASVDALVSAHAPSERIRETLLANPFYQQISASVAGSREFVAMEQLHDLAASDAFELLIVDTPPAQHALDFLDAPERLLTLLDGSGLGLLLRTTSIANRFSFGLLGQGQKQFAKLFEKLTGHRLLLDLTRFYEVFESVIDSFKQRARTMQRLLRSDDVGFVLVLLPQPEGLARAQAFRKRLESEAMRLDGLIFNQVLQLDTGAAVPDAAALTAAGVPAADSAAVAACARRWQSLAAAQQAAMAGWTAAQNTVPIAAVPRYAETVSGAGGLERFATALCLADE